MGKKIGSIDTTWKKKLKNKKWRRKHPLTYIDAQGHARAVPVSRQKGGRVKKGKVAKRKHVKLGGTVVSKDLLKQRKQLKKIFYVTKSGSIMETKSGLGKKRRRKKARKAASRSRKMTKRKKSSRSRSRSRSRRR